MIVYINSPRMLELAEKLKNILPNLELHEQNADKVLKTPSDETLTDETPEIILVELETDDDRLNRLREKFPNAKIIGATDATPTRKQKDTYTALRPTAIINVNNRLSIKRAFRATSRSSSADGASNTNKLIYGSLVIDFENNDLSYGGVSLKEFCRGRDEDMLSNRQLRMIARLLKTPDTIIRKHAVLNALGIIVNDENLIQFDKDVRQIQEKLKIFTKNRTIYCPGQNFVKLSSENIRPPTVTAWPFAGKRRA